MEKLQKIFRKYPQFLKDGKKFNFLLKMFSTSFEKNVLSKLNRYFGYFSKNSTFHVVGS